MPMNSSKSTTNSSQVTVHFVLLMMFSPWSQRSDHRNRSHHSHIGVQSLMRDLGGERAVRMSMGSSAALALNLRQGLGKAKHICIQELWMQEAIKAGRISVDKFPGEHNPADLFTKGISEDRTAYLMEVLGYRYP